MKQIVIFYFFLLWSFLVVAQGTNSGYIAYRDTGIQRYNVGKLQEALKNFKAAKIYLDKQASTKEIDTWILRASPIQVNSKTAVTKRPVTLKQTKKEKKETPPPKTILVRKSQPQLSKFQNTDSINSKKEKFSNRLIDYVLRLGNSSRRNKEYEASEERINDCKALIDSGADVNYVNREPALHWAAYFNFKNIVSFLIKNGSKVNLIDKDGGTPLNFLGESKYDPLDATNILVENGANINFKNKSGETPLLTALNHSNYYSALRLIDAGANVTFPNNEGETPLHIVAIHPWMGKWSEKSYDLLYSLLTHKANINAKTKDGNTPLHYAAQTRNLKAALMLLDQGALINVRNSKGRIALHVAAEEFDDNETIQILVKKGEDIEAGDYDGNTPLLLAAAEGNKKNIEMLMQLNASRLACNNDKETVLHYAAGKCNIELCQMLFYGALINATDKMGNTPLHISADNNSCEAAEFLINKGANVNAKNKFGKTALHLASENNSDQLIKTLLSHNATLNVQDNDGFTPLHYSNDEDVRRLLKSYGAR